MRLGGGLSILMAVVLLGACGGPRTTASPAPSLTTKATATQRCSKLVERGIEPCPPANLEWLDAPIVNATGGAVSQTEAERWGKAALRTETFYLWAVEQAAASFLESGALAPSAQARMNLYSFELQTIRAARQAHGAMAIQAPRITRVRVVAMPQQLQQSAQAQQLLPAPYAMVVSTLGPAKVAIRLPDGTEQTKSQQGADEARSYIVWGEYRDDSELGPIWYEHGYYGCQDALVQTACNS
jgi:hypothetical protein